MAHRVWATAEAMPEFPMLADIPTDTEGYAEVAEYSGVQVTPSEQSATIRYKTGSGPQTVTASDPVLPSEGQTFPGETVVSFRAFGGSGSASFLLA
jgi:hypothetical protein